MLGSTRLRAGITVAEPVERTELEPAPRARPVRGAGLLAVFFASLYLLTMAGHLDSPDEELMFQATRGLVERGSLDVGDAASPERLAFPGVDGRTYAPYGPVSSILSVPFYLLGEAFAQLAPPRYSDYLERFTVALRDVVVTTAWCLVFLATARILGYAQRVSVLLTLAFGTATLVWPYARYSWSEPVTGLCLLLSVYAAMRGVRQQHLGWSALSGIAIGLAIGSKVTTAVAVPGLLAYLAWHRRRTALPFAAVLLLPALGVAGVDLMRFGNPLDTGYHLDGLVDLTQPVGIPGLLVSPGKSVFLYAPIALLGLLGFTRLLPLEAGLFGFIVLSHVLLYGVLAIWAGDAAWGPRYLVPVLAFLVLPAGAVLRQQWRLFVLLTSAGLAVNLGGVLLDQRVSYVDLLGTAQREHQTLEALRWNPVYSPPLLHWRLLAARYARVPSGLAAPVALESGTYQSEGGLSDGFPAWTSGDAVLDVRQPATLRMRYRDTRPAALGDAKVQVLVGGEPIAITPTRANVSDPDNARVYDVTFAVPRPGHVDIRSNTFVPARESAPSDDIRQLGIDIVSLTAATAPQGTEQPVRMAEFPPMPVSDAQPWSFELSTWFWGASTHLADVWPWYLWLSGLPRWLVLLALVPAGALVWSAWRLRLALRMCS